MGKFADFNIKNNTEILMSAKAIVVVIMFKIIRS